ncbi:hypothetical protein U1Q18_022077 [Sarracenia purpurea var. burkii]
MVVSRNPPRIFSKGRLHIYKNSRIQGCKRKREERHTPILDVKWTSPARDFLKINYGGARRTKGNNGVGVVIWDHKGLVVAAMAEPILHSTGSDHIESWAMWKAVSLAKELAFQNIHIKGDALTVIKAINTTENNRSNIGGIIEGIKVELALFPKLICFTLEKMATRWPLAKLATSLNEPMTW